ncbi:MAG: DUF1819 family protein, partial [Treponema sp.]
KNLYQVRAEDRTKRIAGIIFRRLAVLSPELREELITADSAAAKIIVLVSIMKTDLLFAEFMQQVFRKAVQLGENELSAGEIKNFFDIKIAQSEVVSKFSDRTIAKLKQTYTRLLIDAGLIESAQHKTILPVFVDYHIQNMFKNAGLLPYLSAVTGVEYEN